MQIKLLTFFTIQFPYNFIVFIFGLVDALVVIVIHTT